MVLTGLWQSRSLFSYERDKKTSPSNVTVTCVVNTEHAATPVCATKTFRVLKSLHRISKPILNWYRAEQLTACTTTHIAMPV